MVNTACYKADADGLLPIYSASLAMYHPEDHFEEDDLYAKSAILYWKMKKMEQLASLVFKSRRHSLIPILMMKIYLAFRLSNPHLKPLN